MTMAQSFAALARSGTAPALLNNCKLEWAGCEIYGEEAIGESFRASPIAAAGDQLFLESPHQAAWFVGEAALFADLYDGRIGRLWRIGPGTPPPREPSVSVAFDPDLRQSRGGLYARAEDHPLLSSAHLTLVQAAGQDLIAPGVSTAQFRARAFLLRAFSTGDHAAALYAVHRLSGGAVRSSSFSFAACFFRATTSGASLFASREFSNAMPITSKPWS